MIVVFRKKYIQKSHRWGPVDRDDPIHVDNIVNYTKDKGNIAKMKAILPSSKATKGRRGWIVVEVNDIEISCNCMLCAVHFLLLFIIKKPESHF